MFSFSRQRQQHHTKRYAFPICPVQVFLHHILHHLASFAFTHYNYFEGEKKTHKQFSFECKDSFTSSSFISCTSYRYLFLYFLYLFLIINKLLETILSFIYCQAFVLFRFHNYYFLLSCAIVRYTPYSTHLHCFVLVRSSLVYALFHLTLT